MARFFTKANKDGKNLNLTILGVIGNSDWWEYKVSASDVMEVLQYYGEVEEINLTIKSPGGSVVEGTAIYEALRQHSAKVNIKIIGECCSIATVIAMAGDTIEMADTAIFMIHNPITALTGNAEDLRDMAEILDMIKENIINAYTTKTKLSREEISKLMNNEKTMNAAEALEKGFITGILKNDNKEKSIKNIMNIALENYKFSNNKKKESESMDIKELQNKHPELFKEVLNLGGEKERERLQKLDNLAAKNTNLENAKLINKAKYETLQNATDIMETLFINLSGEKTTTPAPIENKNKNFIDNFKTNAEIVNKETELNHLEAKKAEEELNEAITDIVNIANEI